MNDFNPIILHPSGERIIDGMMYDDKRLQASLRIHLKTVTAPAKGKVMRHFSASEVADILGLNVATLRKMHHEHRIPEVVQDARGYRNYTVADIDAIRRHLAVTSKDGKHYMTGRRKGEHLQILTTSTFKGGSSKTTSAVHIAQRLALKGYRVLAIDMDPQASMTSLLGVSLDLELDDEDSLCIYDAIKYQDSAPMRDVIRKTYFHGLDLAPGALILSEFETETSQYMRHEGYTPFYLRLRRAIDQVEDDYDVVIVDCPPQLGFLTITALVAATGLLITVVPNMLDVCSLSQYLSMSTSTLQVVESYGMSINYDFQKYLLCRYEPSDGPQTQMAGFLRSIFGRKVMIETFLKSTAVSDAGLSQKTLYEVGRAETNRQTLDRALESINKVVDELELSIRQAWGRD